MYLPPHFREDRPEVLRDFIRKHPLATLVTLGADGLIANHIPVLFDPEPAPHGTLRGHLSRANQQWQDYDRDVETLAIFQGPQAYISPNWYPTRQEHGRVVPTWNYIAVHVYGTLTVYSDPDRLNRFLHDLTAAHELHFPAPWTPSDAPRQYIDRLLKAIIGIELSISRVEGKWKVSQNQPVENREGAAAALDAQNDEQTAEIARLIRG